MELFLGWMVMERCSRNAGLVDLTTLGRSGMGDALATPACLIGRLGPWGKFEPGELRLEDGRITFTSQERGLVFQAPVQEVRASFPKMYFGVTAKLAVGGKTYRLWFVPMESMAGERESEFGEGRIGRWWPATRCC
jgi:hypothetical protein